MVLKNDFKFLKKYSYQVEASSYLRWFSSSFEFKVDTMYIEKWDVCETHSWHQFYEVLSLRFCIQFLTLGSKWPLVL